MSSKKGKVRGGVGRWAGGQSGHFSLSLSPTIPPQQGKNACLYFSMGREGGFNRTLLFATFIFS
jgi:hypothetical protein